MAIYEIAQMLPDFLLKLWESKLAASKALEPPPMEPEVVLAPSAVPMRMPQPKLQTKTAVATVEGAAAPQPVQAQQVAGETLL